MGRFLEVGKDTWVDTDKVEAVAVETEDSKITVKFRLNGFVMQAPAPSYDEAVSLAHRIMRVGEKADSPPETGGKASKADTKPANFMGIFGLIKDHGRARKFAIMPEYVIRAWSDTIAKNYSNGVSRFTQTEIMEAIIAGAGAAMQSVTRSTVYEKKWLDVEDIFRADGWEVDYDAPGFSESYPARFTFKRKRGG